MKKIVSLFLFENLPFGGQNYVETAGRLFASRLTYVMVPIKVFEEIKNFYNGGLTIPTGEEAWSLCSHMTPPLLCRTNLAATLVVRTDC